MFYYAWLLGLPLAAFFAVAISLWFEVGEDRESRAKK